MASEMSTELFLSVFIGLKGPLIFDAVVCEIKDRSFDCIVLDTGVHQRLYYEVIMFKIFCDSSFNLLVKKLEI